MKLIPFLFASATCIGLLSPVAHAQTDAATLFHARCAMCHGADGHGNTPAGKAFKAVDYQDPAVMKMTDAELTAIISNGKGKMPAYGKRLDASQILGLVDYIRTLQKK